MGLVDRIQESAARSAAARQAEQPASGRSTGRRGTGSPRRPRKVPSPPMSQEERYIGYALAGALAVVFAVLWAPHIGQPHFGEVVTKAAKGVKAKTTTTSSTAELAFGLVLSALVGWSAVLKKRWLLAGVVFYVGLLGPGIGAASATVGISHDYHYLGYLLMAFGAWQLFRNAKFQAEAQRTADAAAAKANRAKSSKGAPTRSSGAASGAGRAAATRRSTAAGATRTTNAARSARKDKKAAQTDASGRPIPAPSKRYTPPQAPSKGDRNERRERRESVRAGGAKPGAANAGAKTGSANAGAKTGSAKTGSAKTGSANAGSGKAGANSTANRSASPKV